MPDERIEATKTAIKIRVREPLRERLETEAQRHGYSLNAEIINRIEGSLRDQDAGRTVFGGMWLFGLMDGMARMIRATEMITGKSALQDREVLYQAIETFLLVLKRGPELLATGEYPGGVRTDADRLALTAIAMMVRNDLGLRAEYEKADAAPPGDGAKPSDEAA